VVVRLGQQYLKNTSHLVMKSKGSVEEENKAIALGKNIHG
jgi:hypothetical protein